MPLGETFTGPDRPMKTLDEKSAKEEADILVKRLSDDLSKLEETASGEAFQEAYMKATVEYDEQLRRVLAPYPNLLTEYEDKLKKSIGEKVLAIAMRDNGANPK